MTGVIIEHISEMILLLGSDGRIIMGNIRSPEILGIRPEELKGKYYFDVIRNSDAIHDRIAVYLKSEEKNLFIQIDYKNNDGGVSMATHFSKILDKFEDHSGFLVISRIKEDNPVDSVLSFICGGLRRW